MTSRRATAVAALCVFALAAWLASESAADDVPPQADTLLLAAPGQVGELHIGDSVASLHRRRLIGRLRPGCELDPGQRVAPLRPPLRGQAVFFHGGRRLSLINVQAGARTARGVTTGTAVGAARRAYPKASYDPPGSVRPFAEGFIWVDDSEAPKMTFVIAPGNRRVEAIAIPSPSFCE